MASPKFYIRTYGCQMNERDSQIMAGQLQQMGYERADKETSADLIIVNTCAVRGSAEEHAFGYIGQLKQLKDEKPQMRLAVAGCMSQEPGTVAWLKKHASHVDLVFGTHNLHELPKLLDEVEQHDEMVVDVWKSAGEVVEHLPSQRAEGVQAFVNIIYGCDKFCTYCIVPFTRGKERSREVAAIVEEVQSLAREGYQDITVLGQNVNSYGHDLNPAVDLGDLLQELEKIDGVRWLRYTTSHPRDFSSRLIEVIAASEKITHHVHLPVQAGSNAILKRMNRKYTREHYLDLIDQVKRAIPDVTLTTDIIVGFPGETEEDFEQTLDLVRTVRYDAAFTFLYSPREGTPAARWEGRDPVPNPVKKERLNRLMELQYQISWEANQRLIGRTELVLIEGLSKKNPNVWAGRTQSNKVVLVARDPAEDLIDRFVPVKITEAKTFYLAGQVAGKPVSDVSPRRRVELPLV
ncbi:MAG: tRNA (N6-isopentenyl adenosine(37)-C2)-methylthiotransferase MiaB [Sulfobacillus thermosulfidooxidans]|uniref:tRNA-2-methylthio-N(6)-dimethylallyladenosine synthase n=1 Tax=Sulfobacillus thermotolerans TaxID=338644 RepID=A0ABM6RQK7_9FIRM|nr:tRNA (N6-isopentenyl adenosine(37)-C2)-methylthiotransferase MiaB [Sulfobacillus sp. hq2]AUW93684.1 tRNA (N6-isopentenyl adenosine(37)-C2)-methylthiotransferase MiaB [Sulfobacillus thermotolerans]POB10930.1 tRNA (N6-isopentenyl adenosine(37)-C2)-methylthiotransferase MiaB [Sulfobacillus sp. hq2]PSR37473.1 MAG: tRNA (N6-isopentenyl adenosine(37)-C2)-methylthiotransferase MiaB [Sulfobacillus thermosulfidooxidans]